MSEHITRERVLETARSWKGTRFHHQGRLKRTVDHLGGCDCIGFILGVADELKLKCKDGELLRDKDERNYSHQPDGIKLKDSLDECLIPIDIENMQAADLLLMKFNKNPQHVAIVSNYPGGQGIIHCYARSRAVVEHRLDDNWKNRIVSAYHFPDLASS